jgi:hypothetical protein
LIFIVCFYVFDILQKHYIKFLYFGEIGFRYLLCVQKVPPKNVPGLRRGRLVHCRKGKFVVSLAELAPAHELLKARFISRGTTPIRSQILTFPSQWATQKKSSLFITK